MLLWKNIFVFRAVFSHLLSIISTSRKIYDKESSKKILYVAKSDGADFSFHRTCNKQKLLTEMIYASNDLQI
jgi:hypothetical protein